MIQLTFEPALDPFHAIFRLLRLRPSLMKVGPLPRDQVRILDFYLLFPYRAVDIRLTPQHRKYRKLASQYESVRPYGDQPEDSALLKRMEPMQLAALDTLAGHNLIDFERWRLGEVRITTAQVPEDLAGRVEAANKHDSELMDFLDTLGSAYQLTGPGGLKDRTGLLEYRYDAV